MRIFAFIIGALVAYNSFGIYILTQRTTPSYSAGIESVENAHKLDLADYFAQKGKIAVKNTTSFDTLLATLPSNILGATTVPSSSESHHLQPTLRFHSGQATYNHLTIAVLGDSMVDTLGSDLPHLKKELSRRFPGIEFTLINHGVGASNIETGLTRLTNGYNYLGENRPAVLSQNPDIIVIESFAYNHWENTQSDLDRQWITLAKMTETIKSKNPDTKIVLATTIAPYCPTYTDGSANLPPERKSVECATVKAYLQNLINFAGSQGYPLADAYHASLSGGDGNLKYINQSDHIHPSDSGKALFSQKIAAAIEKVL